MRGHAQSCVTTITDPEQIRFAAGEMMLGANLGDAFSCQPFLTCLSSRSRRRESPLRCPDGFEFQTELLISAPGLMLRSSVFIGGTAGSEVVPFVRNQLTDVAVVPSV